jgi:hypothetical protein
MTLEQWADNGWLRPHATSRKEIEGLFSIVERDLKDATQEGISSDWRFGIAYNAALKLCTILLHASGYRAEKALQHYRSVQALPLSLDRIGKMTPTIWTLVGPNATWPSTPSPAWRRTGTPMSFGNSLRCCARMSWVG